MATVVDLRIKIFNDSSEHPSIIQRVTARSFQIPRSSSITIFYSPENKEQIVQSLTAANIAIHSQKENTLTITYESIDRVEQIKKSLNTLKTANFINESFVRNIIEHFPTLALLSSSINNSMRGYYRTSASREPREMSFNPRRNSAAFFNTRHHGTSESSRSLPMPDTGSNSKKIEELELIVPHEYSCPLSLSIMTNPVYILADETGQRFERSWISRWLTEKGEHPSTRIKFKPEDLTSDESLKETINSFVESSLTTTSSLKK